MYATAYDIVQRHMTLHTLYNVVQCMPYGTIHNVQRHTAYIVQCHTYNVMQRIHCTIICHCTMYAV